MDDALSINTQDQLGTHVQNIMTEAIQRHASDIHIEPGLHDYRLRYRIDGLLHDIATIPHDLALRIVTRFKIMGQLDIAEKRLPQDGRITLTKPHPTTLRINSCPAIHGEKLVLRLNAMNISLNLNELGLTPSQYDLFYSRLMHPHGMILVTGPTGSGKTVTLYSALKMLNTSVTNIITLEDPVEIELPGTTQIQMNEHIGLNFSGILRSILRQDPDIMMVGEIRDQETAALATHAANTGHLLLTTLHTNDAYEAFSRLQSLGLPMASILQAVTLIIAQRLVRKLCRECKYAVRLSSLHPLKHTAPSIDIIFEAKGCAHCHEGYQGRTAIYELLPVSGELADFIRRNATRQTIMTRLSNKQWISLQAACIEKIIAGDTTFNEYLRVLGGLSPHVQ